MLITLQACLAKSAVEPSNSPTTSPIVAVKPITSPSKICNAASSNALVYVAGYLVHRVKLKHTCDCCALLCKEGTLDDSDLFFMHLKAICSGNFGRLQVPSDAVVKLLTAIESKFVSVLQSFVHMPKCLASLSHEVRVSVHPAQFMPMVCNVVLVMMVDIYLCLRMHAELPSVLSNISKKSSKKDIGRKNRKLSKLKHE